jgi:hypothetical protein
MYPVCSICGEQPVVAWFEGPEFDHFVRSPDEVRAEDAWLACEVCIDLVEADDRDGLVRRAVGRVRRKERTTGSYSGLTDDELTSMERHTLDRFWNARSV